ncbi:hypothetical protein AXK11_06935 [Cephaloticoccus primus]|uniref:RNA polymerase subunit sigma-24 n=1 Tax=Cephaloticoccus primus TaxID=1548207 RepID=A0A139SKJ9_9BACT|nr:sigma-70 family RNA polymerase sigma factor [Cephaloticoccus primus]KXU35083.1 hypothetical protein AXK11_06935 [Cephaloticoccus primus]
MPPNSTPPPQTEPPSDQTHWFNDEVQPHAAALRGYLSNAFPSVRGEVDDVVQDSLLRVWLAWAKRPIRSARGFLFQVARNRAIDVLRRSKASPAEAVEDCDAVLSSAISVAQEAAAATVSREEKARLLAEAIDALPARCREVVVLRKLRLIPQREVAQRLGLSEKTVESQLARGIKRIEARLRGLGIHHYYDGHE